MSRTFARFVTTSIICVLAIASMAPTAPQAGGEALSADDALKALREDLQSTRADIMAKNITLTADQAAKFWPLFEQYQKEQNVIMDDQLKSVQKYADSFQNLDDADALALINAHMDRDSKMNDLRRRWLMEFQKALPTKLAVRVIQIDRRLSLSTQMEIAARIPLVH